MRRSEPRASSVTLLLACALSGLACTAPRVTVRPEPGGRVVLRIRAQGARKATLSGSMNGWRSEPLEVRGDAFEVALDLAPGRYEYRLEVIDERGAHVLFSEGAERVPDGFGGENAVLRVR